MNMYIFIVLIIFLIILVLAVFYVFFILYISWPINILFKCFVHFSIELFDFILKAYFILLL